LTLDNPFGRQKRFAIKPVLLSVLTQKVSVKGEGTELGKPNGLKHFKCYQARGNALNAADFWYPVEMLCIVYGAGVKTPTSSTELELLDPLERVVVVSSSMNGMSRKHERRVVRCEKDHC
jgi:hypothetical protein